MILLKLIGHEYLNEISDIIKLFFGKEVIRPYDNSENDTMNGEHVLIESEIITAENKTFYKSSYSCLADDKTDDYTLVKEGGLLNSKEMKKALKVSMYKLLSKTTDKQLPWGILTGIRPIKIVHQLLEKNLGEDEIIHCLKDEYYVSDDRALLSIKVALAEEKYIRKPDKNRISIYIGIPFCPTRCSYCSFTSNPIDKSKDLVQPYLDALMMEINQVSQYLKNRGIKAQSVYIGGGTPTSLSAEDLNKLLRCVNGFWNGSEEFTCEAGRPDTITADKLKVLKNQGITRLSINPQTMDDETLTRIGRKHDHAQIIESFHLARSLGFDNINMDMILGLPGEGLEEVKNTLNWMARLNPENVTVHTLAIKRASIYNEISPDMGKHCDDMVYEMMELAREALEGYGYHPYYLYRQKYMAQNLENIGFCKKDKECIYNIQIMEEKQSIIAFGADSVTKVFFQEEDRLERQHDIKDLKLYIKNIKAQIDKKLELLSKLF